MLCSLDDHVKIHSCCVPWLVHTGLPCLTTGCCTLNQLHAVFARRPCSGTMPLTCCHSPPGSYVCLWRHQGLLPTGLPRALHLGSQDTGLGSNQASPRCTPNFPPAMLLPFLDSCGGLTGAGWGVPHPGCRSVAFPTPPLISPPPLLSQPLHRFKLHRWPVSCAAVLPYLQFVLLVTFCSHTHTYSQLLGDWCQKHSHHRFTLVRQP